MAKKQLPEGFTGIWIPAELYHHAQLNGSDRELLGAICSFHKSGSKYTDIGYIANLFGVDKSNIRKRVTKLEKSGYLVRDDRNKQTGGSNLISPTPKCYGFDSANCAPQAKSPTRQAKSPTRQAKSPTPAGEIAYPPQAKSPTDNKQNNKKDNKQNKKNCASDNAQFAPEPDLSSVEDWFKSEFWPVYPNKKDKARALKAMQKHKPDADLRADIIDGLGKQILERKLKASVGEWMPEWKLPSTWINGKNWEDAVELVAKESPKQRPGSQISFETGSWDWYQSVHANYVSETYDPEGFTVTIEQLFEQWKAEYPQHADNTGTQSGSSHFDIIDAEYVVEM